MRAPLRLPVFDPRGVVHIVARHVIVHRDIRQVGDIEITETFGEERVRRDDGVRLDDLPPRAVEVRHILFRHGTPTITDFLRLDSGGFHRIGILLEIGFAHLLKVENRSEFIRSVLRNAFGIELCDARDLLQLDAPAFNRVAVDHFAARHEHDQTAMQDDRRQQHGSEIGFPPLAIGDEHDDGLREQDVPRVFRADQHDTGADDKCDESACGKALGLAAVPAASHMQLIGDAEPPDEGEREQRRFRQADGGEHRNRAQQEEQDDDGALPYPGRRDGVRIILRLGSRLAGWRQHSSVVIGPLLQPRKIEEPVHCG